MRHNNNIPLKFTTILSASSGDIYAIEDILKHYDCYICTCSSRLLYDENGNVSKVVNEELKGLIKTALVIRILKFKVARSDEDDY